MFKKIHKTIEIEGMHCEGCANRVKNVLSSIPEIVFGEKYGIITELN